MRCELVLQRGIERDGEMGGRISGVLQHWEGEVREGEGLF